MADEKPAGGGWEWGMIEIILGILLIIGVLDHLFGNGGILTDTNKPMPTYSSTATQASKPESNLDEQCGLTIIKPHTNEKISGMVAVGGTAGSCDWRTTPTVALYAQVVDSKGKPVSTYVAIPPARVYQDEVAFDSTVALTAKPASGTGYLILSPAVPVGGTRGVSARIPLQF